jgi:pyruvate-ferredoxin/flavodoxin oxidoreductase
VVGGRYGLGSKEFTPGMVKGVFDAPRRLGAAEPFHRRHHRRRHRHLAGLRGGLQHRGGDVRRCVFIGLGADGTVGANKNSIKIIGEQTSNYAQGYFVYDSKKSGSMTISHLRFGPRPIRAPYLISVADFVACSQFSFVGARTC